MSKSTIAALKNYVDRISEDTYQYSQAGLTQYSYNNVSEEDIAPNGLVVGSLGGGGTRVSSVVF